MIKSHDECLIYYKCLIINGSHIDQPFHEYILLIQKIVLLKRKRKGESLKFLFQNQYKI